MHEEHPDSVPWLSNKEQALWRAWLAAARGVERAIEASLVDVADISSADFSVLVTLSESDTGVLRMRELCDGLDWDRSRMSHQIARMEKRGLVTKQRSVGDARGIDVALTAAGHATVEKAAPSHVRLVRSVMFDQLDDLDTATWVPFLNRVSNRCIELAGTCENSAIPCRPDPEEADEHRQVPGPAS